jgi:hypothetical protein
MTALTKFNPFTTTRSWNPWRELDDLQGRINTMFIPTPANGDADDTFALTGWSPVVDIAEDERENRVAPTPDIAALGRRFLAAVRSSINLVPTFIPLIPTFIGPTISYQTMEPALVGASAPG